MPCESHRLADRNHLDCQKGWDAMKRRDRKVRVKEETVAAAAAEEGGDCSLWWMIVTMGRPKCKTNSGIVLKPAAPEEAAQAAAAEPDLLADLATDLETASTAAVRRKQGSFHVLTTVGWVPDPDTLLSSEGWRAPAFSWPLRREREQPNSPRSRTGRLRVLDFWEWCLTTGRSVWRRSHMDSGSPCMSSLGPQIGTATMLLLLSSTSWYLFAPEFLADYRHLVGGISGILLGRNRGQMLN